MNPIDQDIALWAVKAISAIGGAGGIVAVIKSGADRRKIIADTGKAGVEAVAIMTNTAIELVNSMRTQIADLETRLKAAETRAEAAETRLRQCGRT